MPAAAPSSAAAASASPQIFSQGGQKGRRRESGFTPSADNRGATQTLNGRSAWVTRGFGDCPSKVIGSCIEVHRELGPGLLEAIYEERLCDELRSQGLAFERQKPVPVMYKGRTLDQGYRTNLIVEGQLLVEIKAVNSLLPIHIAQTVSYLRLCALEAGLLVNFNAETIRGGLRRVFRTPQTFCPSALPVKKSGSV